MAPRFGTDGIRGVAGTELTPELALALGRAAARLVPGSPFLLGRDTRRSGTMLQAALAAGHRGRGRRRRRRRGHPDAGPRLAGGRPGRARPRWSRPRTTPSATTASSCSVPAAPSSPTELEIAIQDELDRLSSPAAIHEAAGLPGVDQDGTRVRRGLQAPGSACCGRTPRRSSAYVDHLVSAVAGGARLESRGRRRLRERRREHRRAGGARAARDRPPGPVGRARTASTSTPAAARPISGRSRRPS